MRVYLTSFLLLLAAASLEAQGLDEQSIKALVKSLGSANFQERTKASKALLDLPGAAPALRHALGSADPEVRRRAAEILDYFDREPVRRLNAAVQNGRVDRFIELLAPWPSGKFEEDTWFAFRQLANKLVHLHQKMDGSKMELFRNPGFLKPAVICAKRVTEDTACSEGHVHFIRASEVDLGPSRRKPGEARKNSFDYMPAIAAARSVHISPDKSCVIFAGGSVSVEEEGIGNSLIVSCGDVTLNCKVVNSLIIARGKVTIGERGMVNCRIISGKSVVYDKMGSRDSIITENEPNPLGYIRWADAPKDKPASKKK